MANAIKLSEVRSAINEKKGTISQIIKGMYSYDDCKELKSLLPAKKDLLDITAIICKEMGIGEKYTITYKDGRSVERVRKPSFEQAVFRFGFALLGKASGRYYANHCR